MTQAKGKPEFVLDSEEVCRIIDASARAGVRVLKFGGLYLQMGEPKAVRESLPDSPPLAAHTPTPATEIAELNHVSQSQDALELDELQEREDQIAELLLTDPLRAEELIRDGELEEDDGRPDEEA